MFFDGSKRQQGAGAGVVLISPKGTKLRYVLQINFSNASSNEAEYEALLHDMHMAKTCGATRLSIYGDSNLVIQQPMRDCNAVADNMMAYQKLYNTLEGGFDSCELNYISQSKQHRGRRARKHRLDLRTITTRYIPREHQPKVNQNKDSGTRGSCRGRLHKRDSAGGGREP